MADWKNELLLIKLWTGDQTHDYVGQTQLML